MERLVSRWCLAFSLDDGLSTSFRPVREGAQHDSTGSRPGYVGELSHHGSRTETNKQRGEKRRGGRESVLLSFVETNVMDKATPESSSDNILHSRAFVWMMQDPENLDYASTATIVFQRASVMVSELFVLLMPITLNCAGGQVQQQQTKENTAFVRWRSRLLLFLLAFHPGLMIVDHIHFQYNGVLLGLFLLAISAVESGREVTGSILFASLLCSKHIFLYAAPSFFVFLLRHYCQGEKALLKFCLLATAAALPVIACFGPYLAIGELQQLLGRMFPVQRGLLHAYWAPNVWALYALADKLMSYGSQAVSKALSRFVFEEYNARKMDNKLFNFAIRTLNAVRVRSGSSRGPVPANLTGGLVGETSFAILPNLGPKATAACTILTMIPCLVALWRNPLPDRFSRAVTYCTLTAFLFGFHVHEKAILMSLIPLAVLAAKGRDKEAGEDYIFLVTVGSYSLFPLLINNEEYGIKILILVLYLAVAVPWIRNPCFWEFLLETSNAVESKQLHEHTSQQFNCTVSEKQNKRKTNNNDRSGHAQSPLPSSLLSTKWKSLYLWGLLPLEIYCSIVHYILLRDTLPFLPLMLTSVYCAFGIVWAWLSMAMRYCQDLGHDFGTMPTALLRKKEKCV